MSSDLKRTTGGKFDPDAGRLYFIASNPGNVARVQYPNVLVAVNEVETKGDREKLDRLCDQSNVLLDSGIFNLAMSHAHAHDLTHDQALALHPTEVDGFPELWDRYGEVATRYADRLWGVIELDQGGAAVKPETRARIESELGVTPMPVYHPLLDGWDYFDAIAGSYDRMCMGNLVKASPPLRTRLLWTLTERARAYPELWTHALGVTPNPAVLGMPWRGSMDSSSWVVGLRWGTSWHASAMTLNASKMPRDMWAVGGGPEALVAGYTVCGFNAAATQAALHDVREDTHP